MNIYRISRLGGAILCLFLLYSTAFSQEGNLTVRSIKILADETTSIEDVKARMATRENAPFSEKALDEDVKRLYSLGYICTKIEKEIDGENVDLKIHVSTRAVVTEISFEGNHRIKTKDLEKDMDLRAGYPAHIYHIRREESRMKDLYKEKGFHFAGIDSELRAKEEGTELLFQVREGPSVKVSRIVFDGNVEISSNKLLKLIRTRRHRWFRPSLYVFQKITADAEVLARHYRGRGWLDATVEAATEFSSDNRQAQVTFTISEEARYITGKVEVSGNNVFTTEEIMSKIILAEGDPFDVTKLGGDIRTIQDMYLSRGYMPTRVATKQSPREEEPVMDVEYVIQEGIKKRIERVDITGNEKTRDEVIRRELLFFPGEDFDSRKVRNSKKALMRNGLFERVDITYEEGSKPELTRLNIGVTEKKTGQLMFGAGYSSYDRVIGFISLSQKNFDWRRWPRSWRDFVEGNSFVGDGQVIKLNLKSGSEAAEYGLDFVEPWIFNKPISFGFGLFSRRRIWSQYDVDRTGGYLSLGRKIGRNGRIRLKYQSERVKLSDVDVNLLPTTGDELGKNILSGVELSGTMDRRNDSFFPTHGYKLRLTYEYVGGPFGGDLDFQKSGVRYDWYRKLFETATGKKHVLKLSGDVRWAKEFSGTSNVPIYEKYYAGGIRTVRGYERRSLGPTRNGEEVGGDFRLVLNAEYIFPLYENVVHGVLFYDAGEVWADDDDFHFSDLRRAAGIGVKFQTPIFPVEFYYGWAFDELPDEPSGRFHFAFGTLF